MLRFKKVHPLAKTPYRATDGSAGFDLYAVSREVINKKTVKYDTGIAFEIPKGYVGLLFPRSSVIKKGLWAFFFYSSGSAFWLSFTSAFSSIIS